MRRESTRCALIGLVVASVGWPGSRAIAADCYSWRPEPPVQHFALVVDASGSMQGHAMESAIAGASAFVEGMRDGDKAMVIAFNGAVHEVHGFTERKKDLRKALSKISAGGGTALHDAIARAVLRLSSTQGTRVIIYLTDGADTASRLTLDDVVQQCVAEVVLVYGIGLGDVDQAALERLSEATGGTFEVARDTYQLSQLYQRVQQTYYQGFAPRLRAGGAYSIRSIPRGLSVLVDGKPVGKTPLKLEGWTQGNHQVQIRYERGTWTCDAPARVGQRTLIDARDEDLGYDLWVASMPHGASVFVDDAYVGTTGMRPLNQDSKRWAEQVKREAGHLRIPLVPPGKHVLRVVPLAEQAEMGNARELAVQIDLGGEETVLLVDLMRGRLLDDEGVLIERERGDRIDDAFGELDDLE